MSETSRDARPTRTQEFLARRAEVVADGGGPARTGRAAVVGPEPLAVAAGEGAWLTDLDGRRYVDWWLADGALLFGHRPKPVLDAVVAQATQAGTAFAAPHELEYEVARKVVAAVPGADRVAFAPSAGAAVTLALRLARAFTGKERVLRFEGARHGLCDAVAVSTAPPPAAAGTARFPRPVPDGAGVPRAAEAAALVAPFNDLDAVAELLRRHDDDVAAVLVEPVLSGVALVPPGDGFLAGLRRLCDEHGALLVLDERLTGLRLAPGGAQEAFAAGADLVCLAGALGGGLAGAAAVAGRAEVMALAADGSVAVAEAGGDPLALAAAAATLDIVLHDGERVYRHLAAVATAVAEGLRGLLREQGVAGSVQQVGSLWQVAFGERQPARTYREALAADQRFAARFRAECRARGVFLPDGAGACAASTAHTRAEVDRTLAALAEALKVTKERLGRPA